LIISNHLKKVMLSYYLIYILIIVLEIVSLGCVQSKITFLIQKICSP